MSVRREASPSATEDDVLSPDAMTILRLRRVMAVFTGVLVASTWPLWTPGTEFPDIPWFEWAVDWPLESWDWLWLAALGGLLMLQVVSLPKSRAWPAILQPVLFISALLLLPTDQHRLQPWVVQMVVGTLLIGLPRSDRRTLRCLRVFTISIYVWSSVSKFDMAFIEGHGQVLLDGLAESVGLSTPMWSETLRFLLAASFPIGEMVIALLLTFGRSRRLGLCGAIAMHVLLILTLGPTGLGHEWGVLVWNAFFIVQAWLIFGDRRSAAMADGSDRESSGDTRLLVWILTGLTWAACLLPALSLVGRWDWWPSWAVYSSRPAIVQASVASDDIASLPASLQAYVGSPKPLSELCPVNLDGWSYETCWCPMYPQERYRMGVIDAVLAEPGILAEVVIRSTPNRRTGKRVQESLTSNELERRMQTYWFNTDERGNRRRRQVD